MLAGTTKHACGDHITIPILQISSILSFEPGFHKREFLWIILPYNGIVDLAYLPYDFYRNVFSKFIIACNTKYYVSATHVLQDITTIIHTD